MRKRNLALPLAAAVLISSGLLSPAIAGHASGHAMYDKMAPLMPHHGFMANERWQQKPARLGVALSAMSQAELSAAAQEYGVRVNKVLEGSAAEKAGLQAGDIVTAVDGRPAYSPERFKYLIDSAGETAGLTVVRDGDSVSLQAEFAPPQVAGKAVLGIRIQEMTEDLKEAFGAEGNQGVLISQVSGDSAADKAGLKAGDVITRIGDDIVAGVVDVHAALKDHAAGDTVDVVILRQHKTMTVLVELGGGIHPHSPRTSEADHPRHLHHHGHYGGHGHERHPGQPHCSTMKRS